MYHVNTKKPSIDPNSFSRKIGSVRNLKEIWYATTCEASE